ncbi:MAG: hypothetical protein ABIS26_02670 [Candidatus Paceibacterota bacterium]
MYSQSSSFVKGGANISWETASLKIIINQGFCPPSFPCYETYKLSSEIGSQGAIFHNDELKGKISEAQAKKLIKISWNTYKSNICTPLYLDKISENYELTIDGKFYAFGEDQGCKEMQDVVNTINK